MDSFGSIPSRGLGHRRAHSLTRLVEEPPPAYPGPESAFTEMSGPGLQHSSSLEMLSTRSAASTGRQFTLFPTAPGSSMLDGTQTQTLPHSHGMTSQELLYQPAAPRLNPETSNVVTTRPMSYPYPPESFSQVSAPHEPPPSQVLFQPIREAVQQSHYYAVYYNPESEELYMNKDGQYHPLPKIRDRTQLEVSLPSAPTSSVLQLQTLPRSSPEPVDTQNVKDYYKCTVVMMCAFVLCLDLLFLVVLLCPALSFAAKAKQAKAHRYYNEAKRNGKIALYLNIAGGILHVLFIIVVVSVVAVLYWVFEIF